MSIHESLSRLMSGELPPDEERRLRARIEHEADVARAWQEIQALPSELRQLPLVAAPPALDHRVLGALERPEHPSRFPWWPLAIAAGLVAGVLVPRPAQRVVIERGSEIVDGRIDVRAAGVDVRVDGRTRISLEPVETPPRANSTEATDMKPMLTGGALGAIVTVAVYEGRARVLDEHGTGIDLRAGETRSVTTAVGLPAQRPAPKNEEQLRAQVDSLQKELDRARFEQALAKGQIAQHEGKARDFPEDLPDVLRPAGFGAALKDLVAGVEGASLLSVDCSEYPCVALVEFADDEGLGRSGLEQGIESKLGLVDPAVSVWAANVQRDDDELYLAALAVYPSTGSGALPPGSTEQATRDKYRVESLFQDTQAERFDGSPAE
jgi:hypothetical protein